MAENSKFRSVEVVGIQVLQLTKLVSRHNDSTVGNDFKTFTPKKIKHCLILSICCHLAIMKLESR